MDIMITEQGLRPHAVERIVEWTTQHTFFLGDRAETSKTKRETIGTVD